MISRTWFDRFNDCIFSMVELRISLQPSDEIYDDCSEEIQLPFMLTFSSSFIAKGENT